jgi:RNA polymerase sigma factor (sigma-70 family)
MSIVLRSIESEKKYTDLANKEFLSLSEYTTLAHWCLRHIKGNLGRLCADEDVVSYIIYSLAMADYNWSPDGGANRATYRTGGAHKAISMCLLKRSRPTKAAYLSDISFPYPAETPDRRRELSPVEILEEQEEQEFIDNFLNSLTPRELDLVQMRLDGATHKDIAEKFGVSKQRSHQIACIVGKKYERFKKCRNRN